ncbi:MULTISPECIES: hypothetical protein [unclassified Francisella]|uniref:hypothetical protein n=1 Tax=unclassified Francisella TaxID=2610885 RepID=UPI002E3007A9|nr:MULTISPECIES: hypothetical protein [unclassified Francisella]MED7819128.1 hypothetical protein [Francisella sp. 19S2-4]MED7831016.1 hypothetical protein [Francisella sp. 19S2-10]
MGQFLIAAAIAVISSFCTYILTSLKIGIGYKYLREQKWLDKELEVATKSWENLQKFRNNALISVNNMKIYPDIKALHVDELEALYKSLELNTSQIKQLEESGENIQKKLQYYIDKKEVYQADKSLIEFEQEFNSSRIFLRPELKKPFKNISKKLKDIVIDRDVYLDYKTNDYYQEKNQKVKEMEEMFRELELSLEEVIFLKNRSLKEKLTSIINQLKSSISNLCGNNS